MLTLTGNDIPPKLRRLPQPPKRLYIEGPLDELLKRPCVGIVGSRKVSQYGRQVTEKLAKQLAERGIVIISGLALGVDSIAQRAALEARGGVIAVLPSSVAEVYPASHRQFAQEILRSGGSLISEYAPNTPTLKSNFIARNRLIAALSDVLVVTEAALKSGSLHTARFALEQGTDVLAVPGNVTSVTSEGTNNLIKAGAGLISSVDDILLALGLDPAADKPQAQADTEAEQVILDLLASGISDGTELLAQSGLPVTIFNQNLTMLEIKGDIRSLGANHWTL